MDDGSIYCPSCRVRVRENQRMKLCDRCSGYSSIAKLSTRVKALEEELALWRRHTEGALGVLCDGYTCHSSTMPCPRADRGTCTASGDVTELCRLMDAYDERQREAKKGAA